MGLFTRIPAVSVVAAVLIAISTTALLAGCKSPTQSHFGDKAEDWKKGTPPPGWHGPGGGKAPGGPPPGPPK